MKPRFNVGQRVKIRIAKDVIKEKTIICDVGFVKNVELRFGNTELEMIIYTIKLDDKYCNSIGRIVTVAEGFNVNTELCSIEKE